MKIRKIFGKDSKGFTLLEVLIATAIFSVVAAASYSVFSVGIQIWKRAKERSSVDYKVLFAFEKMGRDIRSTILTKEKALKGKGSSTQLALPAVVEVRKSPFNGFQYGLIIYQWESLQKGLCRSERSATDIYNKSQAPCRILVGSVRRIQFKYLLHDKIGKDYRWSDEFDEDSDLPAAIQIHLELESGLNSGKKLVKSSYDKTFILPVGGASKEDEFALGKTTTMTLGGSAQQPPAASPASAPASTPPPQR